MSQLESNYYNDNADLFIQSTIAVDMAELYQHFTPHLPKQARVLDAGCGSGRDSLAFTKMGFSVDAFDASLEMVKYAQELTGLPIEHKSFNQIQAVNEYDGIWCCASLLHIPRTDLLESMQVLANALKADGIWYISFKYGSKEREKDGRNFTDLTEDLLDSLVSDMNGIQIKSMWVTVDQRPDRSERWLNALLIKR